MTNSARYVQPIGGAITLREAASVQSRGKIGVPCEARLNPGRNRGEKGVKSVAWGDHGVLVYPHRHGIASNACQRGQDRKGGAFYSATTFLIVLSWRCC